MVQFGLGAADGVSLPETHGVCVADTVITV